VGTYQLWRRLQLCIITTAVLAESQPPEAIWVANLGPGPPPDFDLSASDLKAIDCSGMAAHSTVLFSGSHTGFVLGFAQYDYHDIASCDQILLAYDILEETWLRDRVQLCQVTMFMGAAGTNRIALISVSGGMTA
jgi:hypothetical protein